MKSTLLAVAALCLLSLGCGHSLMQPPTAAPRPLSEPSRANESGPELGDLFTSRVGAYDYLYSSRTDPALLPRVPGDFVVYRFTGSALEQPVILTQRVMNRKASMLIVDQVLDDGDESIHMRLRIRDAGAGHNEIVSVARVHEGVQLPFGTATYRALMDKVLPPIDDTEQLLGSGRGSVDVNGNHIECQTTAYRVRVDGEPAFLTVMQSPSFVWGDVGGEIRDGHGKLLYKAEIVLVSDSFPMSEPSAAAVARAEPDIYDELDGQSAPASAALPDLRASDFNAWIAAQEDLEPYEDLGAYEDWDELR